MDIWQESIATDSGIIAPTPIRGLTTRMLMDRNWVDGGSSSSGSSGGNIGEELDEQPPRPDTAMTDMNGSGSQQLQLLQRTAREASAVAAKYIFAGPQTDPDDISDVMSVISRFHELKRRGCLDIEGDHDTYIRDVCRAVGLPFADRRHSDSALTTTTTATIMPSALDLTQIQLITMAELSRCAWVEELQRWLPYMATGQPQRLYPGIHALSITNMRYTLPLTAAVVTAAFRLREVAIEWLQAVENEMFRMDRCAEVDRTGRAMGCLGSHAGLAGDVGLTGVSSSSIAGSNNCNRPNNHLVSIFHQQPPQGSHEDMGSSNVDMESMALDNPRAHINNELPTLNGPAHHPLQAPPNSPTWSEREWHKSADATIVAIAAAAAAAAPPGPPATLSAYAASRAHDVALALVQACQDDEMDQAAKLTDGLSGVIRDWVERGGAPPQAWVTRDLMLLGEASRLPALRAEAGRARIGGARKTLAAKKKQQRQRKKVNNNNKSTSINNKAKVEGGVASARVSKARGGTKDAERERRKVKRNLRSLEKSMAGCSLGMEE